MTGVALETFNMRSNRGCGLHTQPGRDHAGTLLDGYFPPFSESNLFDSLSDVLDRIKDAKGKKAVLVLASGIDTFSRMTLDQTMKRIRETDATIFTVGVAEMYFMNQGTGAFGQQLTYIQCAKPTQDICGDDRRPRVAPALRW